MALAVLPIHCLVDPTFWHPGRSHHDLPGGMTHMAMYLWLLVFVLQPHKEERFLFPIYPLLCLSAASTLDCIQKLYFFLFVRRNIRRYLNHTWWISVVILSVFGALSLSRVLAVYKNYHAPMKVWTQVARLPLMEKSNTLEHPDYGKSSISICVGKEWYRYPSSFFLPDNNWDLKYIRSEFKGQLPQPYDVTVNSLESTRLIRDTFNDQNKQEPNRFVKDPTKECHYIVDQAVHPDDQTELEPNFSVIQPNVWKEEFSVKFLDARRSHSFFRAFYVPVYSESRCTFNNYTLYKNMRPSMW